MGGLNAADARMMTQREVDDLLEYSTSLPTGTTAGKAWKRRVPWNAPKDRAEWWRGTYGLPYPEGHEFEGQIPIGWRRIRIIGRPAFFPIDISVPPPVMRGRIMAVSIEPPPPPPAELPEGLWDRADGTLMFECLGCERAVELECDPSEFHADTAYCGGSPRCIP